MPGIRIPMVTHWPRSLRIDQSAVSASGERSCIRHSNRLARTEDSSVRHDSHGKVQHHENYAQGDLSHFAGLLPTHNESVSLYSIRMVNTQMRTSKMRQRAVTIQTRLRMFGNRAPAAQQQAFAAGRGDLWHLDSSERPQSQSHAAEFLSRPKPTNGEGDH